MILGQRASQVAGVLLKDGRFEGKINDGKDEYFIERVENYLPHITTQRNSTQLFHSVCIYFILA